MTSFSYLLEPASNQPRSWLYRSGKGIHLLIIISGQGEKLETKLGLQGEMEK
jgi:hypothetical protein